MPLLGNMAFFKWYRPMKAKMEGTNYGPSWIHWEPPKLRSNDNKLLTPADVDQKVLEKKREINIIKGKW